MKPIPAPPKWEEEPDDWKLLPPWGQSAHLYNRHHISCPACVAAGISGGAARRCAEGQALWDDYQQQGTPPHFLWTRPSHTTTAAAAVDDDAVQADLT